MHRLLSLMIVLAHLGVASIPCVEIEVASSMQRLTIGGRATHSMPSVPARKSADAGGHTSQAHPAGHAQGAHASHASHAAAATPHTADAASAMAGPSAAEATSHGVVAESELSAPCRCGCSERSNAASTTTPQPPTFAPLPPEAPRLVLTIRPVVEPAPGPWPRSIIDPPEHVPIAS